MLVSTYSFNKGKNAWQVLRVTIFVYMLKGRTVSRNVLLGPCLCRTTLGRTTLVDMDAPVEDKNVITESPTGCDSAVCEVDANHVPYEGMVFETDVAAKTYFDEYARQKGFLTRIVSSRRSVRDGSIISRRLACNREGFNVNRQNSRSVRIRKRESIRTGCKAMMVVRRKNSGKWVVEGFVEDHNHTLVVSSKKARPTPLNYDFILEIEQSEGQVVDEKDRRIRELSLELNRANQKLAACREQLRTFMEYMEEHTQSLSKTVENAVHNIMEFESGNIYKST
ncbi:hypothetical protein JRO89_XS03G0019100 [Xanthoceras sorbifolium]|uniref:FAR1 domain-containing protein n=1 Tax=Xanthoceras sorbifolium TaxID=99658 RepID=A0ABQ8I857_9ROSI|nr:hypothetical protein JRO89_XS03G0019100 [Xanthoceras sorbifolium]